MKLAIEIAKTQLLAKPKQTIVAMLGVTFGIGLFIALVSLMTGLNKFTEDITMASSPDIRLYHDPVVQQEPILTKIYPHGLIQLHHAKPKKQSAGLRGAMYWLEQLKTDSSFLGVSPMLASQVFFNYGPVQLNGLINGVDIEQEDKMFGIGQKLIAGSVRELKESPDGLIMGSGLAKKLNIAYGDRVNVTTPDGVVFGMRVCGLFQMGLGAIDNVRSYANLSAVQKLLQKDPSYISDINIKMKHNVDAGLKARELARLTEYTAEDWQTANATFLTGNIIRNVITYAVSFTLLIVAGFGIYNILNMTIINKMKDIAILKATGFRSADVRQIFMLQSLAIGILGSLLGLLLGFCLSWLISKAPFNGGDVVSLRHFPVNFAPFYYMVGLVFGVSTTALAGWMPSRRAAKVDPIEIIRGQ